MKKSVFRANYSDVEKLKENITKNMEENEKRLELDKKIDTAKVELNNLKNGKKGKKVDLDD